jgi:hypothetical protein
MARKKETVARELPMNLPKEVVPLSQQGRDFRLRLPPDLSEEIEKESFDTGVPQNRIIINRLSRFGQNDRTVTLDGLINHMETLLAGYGTRLNNVELGEELLQAVDEALAAKPNEIQAKLDKVRLARRGMQAIEQQARKRKE